MKRVYLLLSIMLILIKSNLLSQESLILTQYTSGISVINPAYSGSTGKLTLQSINRNQWIGIEGAPKSHAIIIDSPISGYNFGIGGSLMFYKIGPIKEYHLSVNMAFHTRLNDKINVSFGLKSFVGLLSSDFIGDELVDLGDPYFLSSAKPNMFINFGAGIIISGRNFYFGYSATPLLKNRLKTNNEDNINHYEINTTITHNISGVFSFKLAENITGKPSVLIKADRNLKPTTDLSFTSIFNDRVWFGITYRTSKVISIYTELQVSEKFRIGYAYDFGVSKEYALNAGSHELIGTFDFQMSKKKFITPRYF